MTDKIPHPVQNLINRLISRDDATFLDLTVAKMLEDQAIQIRTMQSFGVPSPHELYESEKCSVESESFNTTQEVMEYVEQRAEELQSTCFLFGDGSVLVFINHGNETEIFPLPPFDKSTLQ